MSQIEIKYGPRSISLPKSSLDIRDMTLIFNVHDDGLHLKVKDENQSWVNVWPQGNLFPEGLIPFGCTEAILIAAEKCTTNTLPQQLSNNMLSPALATSPGLSTSFVRRGGSGPRPIPTKPAKKSKFSSFMKNITVTHVTSDGMLETIYDVPVNITELGQKKSQFTVDDIQNEVKTQVGDVNVKFYVITDKRGHPIRNMPNTRGKHEKT